MSVCSLGQPSIQSVLGWVFQLYRPLVDHPSLWWLQYSGFEISYISRSVRKWKSVKPDAAEMPQSTTPGIRSTSRLIALFHFLIDPLINILSESNIVDLQIQNIETLKGLDGLPDVYKVGTPIQVQTECQVDLGCKLTYIQNHWLRFISIDWDSLPTDQHSLSIHQHSIYVQRLVLTGTQNLLGPVYSN